MDRVSRLGKRGVAVNESPAGGLSRCRKLLQARPDTGKVAVRYNSSLNRMGPVVKRPSLHVPGRARRGAHPAIRPQRPLHRGLGRISPPFRPWSGAPFVPMIQ